MSAIIGTSQYVNYFNNPQGVVQGGIGSALAGGSVIGAMMAGPVSNKMGRRDSIMFACFWWLLGTSRKLSLFTVRQSRVLLKMTDIPQCKLDATVFLCSSLGAS